MNNIPTMVVGMVEFAISVQMVRKRKKKVKKSDTHPKPWKREGITPSTSSP